MPARPSCRPTRRVDGPAEAPVLGGLVALTPAPIFPEVVLTPAPIFPEVALTPAPIFPEEPRP